MSIRFLLTLALVAPACAAPPSSIDAVAEGYVRAALQLAQHDPDLVESWRGDPAWRPGPRVPVAGILGEIERAGAQLSALDPSPRRTYLDYQLRALRFAAERQLGRAAGIDEQAREEFAVAFSTVDRAAIDRAHEQIARLLPGTSPLPVRVRTFRRRTIIPDDRRVAVLGAALEACRQATTAAVPLPAGEGVRLSLVSGLPWDGWARYEGQRRTELQVNGDGALDVARALRLACHEGYPGHHVQHVLIDRIAGERDWPELHLAPGFGRHLLLAEGAAEAAADLAFSRAQRVSLYRDVLLPAAGHDPSMAAPLAHLDDLLIELLPGVTGVARDYLDGAIDRARALERLDTEALVTNPDATLAFIERRRARALVYGEGRRFVLASLPSRDLPGLHAAFQAVAAVQ